jgi:hypothetical protein
MSEDAYIEHVRHTYHWLAPGGELVAVLPIEHPSRIKKRRQFSEWQRRIRSRWRSLPEGESLLQSTEIFRQKRPLLCRGDAINPPLPLIPHAAKSFPVQN